MKIQQKIFQLLNNKQITIINSTHDPDKFTNSDGTIEIKISDETRRQIITNQRKEFPNSQ